MFLLLGLLGIVGAGSSIVPLVFLQYLTLFAAGYFGGRFAGSNQVWHGSLTAIVLYFVTTVITLGITTARPNAFTLALGAIVAAVIGAAGGALAEWRRLTAGPAATD